MESQRLSMLPKSGNEKGLCSSGSGAAILGEAASSHEPMEIQNLSVGEVTDLMAQGEPLSFVIVSEGEGGLEWIENTTVVLESQNVIRPQETERVIVVETSGNGISLQPAEGTRCKSGPKEFVVNRDGMETRKREPPDVLSGHPSAKVIKLSPRDEIISKVDSETKAKHSNSSNVTLISSFSEKPDKSFQTAYYSKDVPAKTFSRESPTVMVVKEDSSFLRVYGSSESSSSSTEGSISNVSFKKELLSDDDTASQQQQITVVTSPTVLTVSDPGQTRQVVTAVDSFRGKQSLRIHSAGANVESTVNKDIVKKEDTKPSEPQKIIQVTGDSISTGVVEGAVVYRCGECDYASTNKHYYKQHVDLVHNTARPFKCPFCDYAGKRGHALREHLIVHSAQRPYSCLHCNATFRKKGHLTNHTKLHATSSGTLCATGLPGGLLGGAGTVKISTVGNHHMGNFVKVPVEGNGPIITVKAEPSGRETTILAPSHKVRPPSAAGISKKKDLWCALCDKEMADAGFFQTHLKTVHGTDRLFACDRCEYVTASKGAILSHLAMHIPTSATTDTPPTTTTTTPPSTPLTPVPLYACTHCGFSSPDMNVFISHAASHNVGAGVGVSTSSASAASKAVPKPAQPQQSQISKAICSVCGHVADSTESMHAHLWTHIDTNAANEPKPKPPPQQSQEQKTVMESVSPPVMEQTSGPCAVGLKTLPENAAFKCTECSYVSRDASQFVKHMLVHKTQQNQTPRIQVQSSSSNSGPATVPVSGASAGKGSYSYKVKPITTENTCQNSESSPFVHDPSRGRFRCTICGYSCEYQRTIKAHIWKHSGHQEVDYPIFQNGPLSMYEDAVPSSQPVVVQGKGSSTAVQPQVTAAPAHTNTLSQPPSSITETTSIASPVSALSANTSVVSSAVTSSGSVPVGVKIFTVSGSQVLQSSAPLPMGGMKLIPVTKPSLPATAEGSKHVIVHVQGAPPPESAVSVVKKVEAPSVGVKNSEPQHRVPSLLSKGATDSEGDSAKGGDDKESKTQSEASVTTEASDKPVTETESHSARSVVTVESVAKTDSGGPAVDEAENTEGTTDDCVMKPVSSIVSAKHTLPVCATVNKQHARVAHPVHAQTDKAQCTVPAAFIATSAVGPTSTVDTSLSESENLGIKSMEESPPPIDSTGSVSNQTLSGNTDSVSRQKTTAVKEDLTTEDPELSIAAQIQNRRSSTTEQSVVVEAVNTVLTPGSYTGQLSQQTSPRVSRSSNSSPVPTHVNPHTVTLSVEQASSRVLRSSKKRFHSEGISLDGVSPKKSLTELALTWKADHSPLSKKSMETQALQDSESAVTLLSLQSRDPNAPLYCPPVGRQTSQEHNSPPESPNRSSSSSSETESLARETPTEGASEDLAHEGELTSGGKNRGGSSGGGICSTLLAVIEQLRERSRSESDAEEKQVAPAVKKRASRRRGRQESEEEVLEIRDSDNIEQLTGEDSVNYRCKLCHYTNARIPLIRLHMRTHRQKDPFECSLCSMVAESSEALQEHMIQHCKVRTYACKVCPQSFNHKSTLRAHMRAHDDPGPNYCYLCEFETSNPLEFRSHMQKHTGSTLLCCPHCPAVVASPQDLRLHQAGNCPSSSSSPVPSADRDRNSQDPNEDAEKVACPKCEFTSTDKARMEDHIAGHTATLGMEAAGEGLLRCALCDFTAVSSRSLKSHMKRHANDQRYVQQPLEQYKCLLCGYVCHHLPSLKSHMWRHASDQNYSYQFTNDVINAAIDYDTRPDPPPQPSRTAGSLSKEGDEPELLEKVLSAERRILEGQMNRPAGLQPVCWVTFRCCQCGFQTINKPKLNLHMRTHADIIQQTLQVSSPSIPPKDCAPNTASAVSSDSVSVKVVYGPV